MVVPDFELICEIMLVAEGFQDARLLARKFITLYTLCKELLSKQDHYDWGLRAIKSVLVVAGSLKVNSFCIHEFHFFLVICGERRSKYSSLFYFHRYRYHNLPFSPISQIYAKIFDKPMRFKVAYQYRQNFFRL